MKAAMEWKKTLTVLKEIHLATAGIFKNKIQLFFFVVWMPKVLIGLCVLKMHVEMSLFNNIEPNKGQWNATL